MKRLLFCALFLFAAPALAQEVDDTSYESLFKFAFQLEMQNDLSRETLEALVKFDALDLMALVEPPYRRKAPSEMHGPRQRVADETFIVAERLFREKRIDEGVALLKAVLPPQAPDEGMLTAGYVSEALLEQKQFDLAWQIADSGRPLNRIEDNFFFVHERIDNRLVA